MVPALAVPGHSGAPLRSVRPSLSGGQGGRLRPRKLVGKAKSPPQFLKKMNLLGSGLNEWEVAWASGAFWHWCRVLTFTTLEKVRSASCAHSWRSCRLRSWPACRCSASGCPGCKCSAAATRTLSYPRAPLGSSTLSVVTVLWNERGPRVTSSCQEPCAASCRYETMEPSPSQSCSLGPRNRERTPGHPSVSALADIRPLQSPG